MPATFRSRTSATSSSASYTIARPTGVVENDILVLAQFADTSTLAAMTTPSGWTQLLSVEAPGGGLVGKLWVKQAGGSEPSTYSLAQTSGADSVAHLFAVEGGALPTTAASSTAGTGTAVTTPGITPTGADDLEIRFAGANGEGTARTFTPAAGFTEPAGADVNSGGWPTAAGGYRALASSSATSAANWTASGTIATGARLGFTVTVASAGEDAEATPDTVAAVAAVPTPTVTVSASPDLATVAATTALPGPDLSAGAGATPDTVAAVAAVPAPSVTTQDVEIVTPATVEVLAEVPEPEVNASVNATLNTIEAVAALYGPDVSAGASVTLATIQVVADVHTPSTAVPVLPGDQITRPGQLEWEGFLLGSGTPYSWQQLEGWVKSAPFISGNVDRPDSSGSYPGQPYQAERAINWGMLIKAPRDTIGQVVHDLVMATGPAQSEDEGWLVVWDFDALQPYLVRAHLADRDPGPINRQARMGLMRGALQWIASDPRRYDPVRSSLTIARDVETAILNNGNDSTPGELRFPGPATGIQVENLATDRVIAFSTVVAEGETLVVDVAQGRAFIGDTNKINDLVQGSASVEDFVFNPGSNPLIYTADTGGTAGMETFWRHAVS